MKKILIFFGVFLLLTACGEVSTTDDIVIGGIVALTGDDTIFGTEDRNTAELRINQLNESGGINGRKLRVIWKDGECNTEAAAQRAEELITDDKVNIILGGTCSSSTLGISGVANKTRILQVAHGGSSLKISKAGRYTFRTIPTNEGEWKVLNQYLFTRDIKSLGVLREDREYNNSMQGKLMTVYRGDVYEEMVIPGETDLTGFVRTLKEQDIDAVLVNVYKKEEFPRILGQLRDLDFRGMILLNGPGLRAIKGTEGLDFFKEVSGTEYYTNDDQSKLEEFAQQYEDYYGNAPHYTNFMGMMVDAIDILSGVLAVVDDPLDTEELVEAMTIVQHVGLVRPIAFDNNGDVEIDHQVFIYNGEEFELMKE